MILLALGANLPSSFGTPAQTLEKAIEALQSRGIRILSRSRLWLTAPVPFDPAQPWYHNAVVAVETSLNPRHLLSEILSIEAGFGRIRSVRNAPRVLDIDLIAYNKQMIAQEEDLIVPHPRFHERAFVLYPIRDIAPEWRHPSRGDTLADLIKSLPVGQRFCPVSWPSEKENLPRFGLFSPVVMGIVNVTPDSFSDGGLYLSAEKGIAHGLQLVTEGASLLDIGGESTRPGSDPVSEEEEIRRIVPVIEGLKGCGIPLSVDTRHAQTMKAALAAGATILNDVSALEGDPESLLVAAGAVERDEAVKICLMHSQGPPKTMQNNPIYEDVVEDVFAYLLGRIDVCLGVGIPRERLIADVGIGFGKTLEHNIKLLRNLSRFQELGVDLMIGASRKRFIPEWTRDQSAPNKRVGGSLAACIAAAQQGVRIFRVHDVRETVQALSVFRGLYPFESTGLITHGSGVDPE